MSSTAAAPQPLSTWAPAMATLVGGEPRASLDAVRLLAAAGFGLCDEPRPGALIVLIAPAPEHARLRAIRDLVEAHPTAPLLAIVPAAVPNTALRRVLLAGATGIVVDEEVERALVASAGAVLAGQLTVPSALGRQIAPRYLSHREREILALVALGLTNREIAHKLFLAESTVKTHLSSAFRKIDARSRSEAVARMQDPEAGYGPSVFAVADADPE